MRDLTETSRRLTAGRVTYGFKALHRTVSRSDSSDPSQELLLTYGADGQVSIATKGGVTYHFLYDEAGRRLAKFAGVAPVAAYLEEGYLDVTGLTERVQLGGRTVGIIRGGRFTTIATDLRGTVLAETNGTACIASPFGHRNVHPEMAAAIDYVEKGYDADLGWVRMGVRDYDPDINRFTTADPLFLESPERCVKSPVECNLYGYAGGDPILNVDPSGMGFWGDLGSAVADKWNSFKEGVVNAIGLGDKVSATAEQMQKAVGREDLLHQIDGLESVSVVDGERNALIKERADSTVGDVLDLARDAVVTHGAGKAIGMVGGVLGKAVAKAGLDLPVSKVVNSNMPHAAERAVGRAGFGSVKEARTALQEFGAGIEKNGLPSSAIQDTAHADRVIVPGFGEGGAVVYQVKDGT